MKTLSLLTAIVLGLVFMVPGEAEARDKRHYKRHYDRDGHRVWVNRGYYSYHRPYYRRPVRVVYGSPYYYQPYYYRPYYYRYPRNSVSFSFGF